MTDARYELLEQGQTIVANFKTDQALIKLAGDKAVYIGRRGRHGIKESPWHNPYRVPQDAATNEEAVAKYRDYLLANPDLLARIEELRGKLLVCWCYPKPCHGNVLVEFLNEAQT